MLGFFRKETSTIVGAAAIVGVLSFASRMVGLVRDRILAGRFGASDTLDVYYAAFKIPEFLFSLLVVGALSASFIPLFTKYYHGIARRDAAWDLTNNILHIIVVAMAVVSALGAIFAVPIAEIIAPGFVEAKQLRVAEFMRIMLISQVLLSASMVFGGVLQGMKRFALYSLAPILYNVGIIVGALVLVDVMGRTGLAWGVVLGAAFHLAIQLYGVMKSGYKYEFRFLPRDRDAIKMIRMMGPRVLGIGLSQLMIVVLTVLATTLAVGSVTVFTFAYNIQFFPVGIIGIAFAIAAFPSFCEYLERNDTNAFIKLFSSTVRQLLFLMIPATVVFLLLRAQIVRVVVGAGVFDWPETILAADTLAFFAFSFIAQSLVFLLARAFFSLHDTWTPFATGLVSTVLGIVSALWLMGEFQGDQKVIALGAGFSIAAIVNAGLLWVILRQRIGTLDEGRIIKSLFSMSIAGIGAAVVVQLLKPVADSLFGLETFLRVFAYGLFAGIGGLLVYLAIAKLLKSEELDTFLGALQRRLFKRYQPEEEVFTESSTGA